MHTSALLQAFPQLPQCVGSVIVSAQDDRPPTAQVVVPDGHVDMHAPPLQWVSGFRRPWPHAAEHASQLLGSELVFVQVPEQFVSPGPHVAAHLPCTQAFPAPQDVVHVPQY